MMKKEGAQRSEPCERLYATDATPSGDGGYVAPITHELTEEKESTCALTGMAMNH